MITWVDMALLLATLAGLVWVWHSRGLHELALGTARRHCRALDVELLDDNVAWRGFALQRDARGRLRMMRRYTFEYTLTGAERLQGMLTLWGRSLGSLQLETDTANSIIPTPTQVYGTNVVDLLEWKRAHPRSKPQTPENPGG